MKSFLVVLLFSVNSFAATYYVKDASGVGVAADDAAAVTEIIKASVGDGDSQTTDASKAQFTLRPKLIKLGGAYIVTLEKVKGSSVVFSAQLKAEKMEELDNVASRLTRAVTQEKAIKDDTRITDINENERVTGSKRREAVKHWQVGLGAAAMSNVNSNNTEFDFLLGYEWEIPVSSAAVKLFWNSSVYFSQFSVGGTYFFNDKDTSLLVTADAGYGSASVKTDNVLVTLSNTISGFVLGAGAGVRFFRTSTINLEAMIHYGYLLNKNNIGNPTATSFIVGVYF